MASTIKLKLRNKTKKYLMYRISFILILLELLIFLLDFRQIFILCKIPTSRAEKIKESTFSESL